MVTRQYDNALDFDSKDLPATVPYVGWREEKRRVGDEGGEGEKGRKGKTQHNGRRHTHDRRSRGPNLDDGNARIFIGLQPRRTNKIKGEGRYPATPMYR